MKFIARQYKEAFLHIKSIRLFVAISVVLFAVTALGGYCLTALFPTFFEKVFELVRETLASTGILDDEGGISAIMLFLNNSRAALLSTLQGFVPFIFMPSFSILLNGSLIGIVLGVRANGGVNPLLLFAAGILPHGIFELSALFLSWGAGMYLCYTMIMLIIGKVGGDGFLTVIKRTAALYCCIVLPLLAAAAVVEAYVTPQIIGAAM